MSPILFLAILAASLCAAPLIMTAINLCLCRRPDRDAPWPDDTPRVFVCIPARNEETNIEACVRSVLYDSDDNIRVVVYDDQSEDQTPAILARLAAEDPRVLPAPTRPLPAGWNGKQHACWRMARAAIDAELGVPALDDRDLLVFTDADVRFEPAALRAAVAEMRRLNADMVSCFPRQITGTLAEATLVPMMFYLLFGYLPMPRMRRTNDPSASAGCGQFLMLTANVYTKSGGHEAFRDSMHDGIMLPRAVRRAGLRSDLFDGSATASVRMYRGFSETWRGFAKNAYEGLGSIGLLVFLTALHAIGHVAPWIIAVWILATGPTAHPASLVLSMVAIALQLSQRLWLANRLDHSRVGALLHPVGVTLMTAIQWHSYVLHVTRRRAWRGRTAGDPTPTPTPGTLD